MNEMSDHCPDERLKGLLERLSREEEGASAEVSALLREYPGDPRLHFLHGSLLAAVRRYDEARGAIAEAVALAPDYPIARFQLGFLEFTSGDAAAASETWRPLLDGAPGDPLRLFVEGLQRLAEDEFAAATALLRRGIDANTANGALNADMHRLIEAVEARHPSDADEEPLSLAQLALRQSAARSTRH
jgi:tetratricopeptide (TPR) repeat protein